MVATLTEVSSKTRKLIKFGVIGLLSFFIFRIALLAGIAYWKKLHPPPPPPPTVEFGKLKRIKFPDQQLRAFTFILQLPTIDFPDFPDRAKVFVIPYKKANFMVWDEAKKESSSLGFIGEPEQLSTQVYRWTKKSPVTTNFKLNIVDGSFTYEYLWQEDPNILAAKNLPGREQAIIDTISFLKNLKGAQMDLAGDEAKVVYLEVNGNKLQPAISISEADLVQVDIFRSKIEQLPVVTPQPAQGVVSTLLSASSRQRILKVNYNYFPVNLSLFATYPIKTPQDAWQDLKTGKGYSASIDEKSSNVVVRRIYLGYYDTLTPESYLQPVYIFTGDNDFIGYVAAITDEWLE